MGTSDAAEAEAEAAEISSPQQAAEKPRAV